MEMKPAVTNEIHTENFEQNFELLHLIDQRFGLGT